MTGTDIGDGTGGGQPAGDITTVQVWDESSRLTERHDDKGNKTEYKYDPLNRRWKTVYADGTAYEIDYNANGTQTGYMYDGITGVPNPPDDFGVKKTIRTKHTVPPRLV